MSDIAHGPLGSVTAQWIGAPESLGKIVSRREASKSCSFARSPYVKVSRKALAKPAVERAHKPIHRMPKCEEDQLAAPTIAQSNGMFVKLEFIAMSLEGCLDCGSARLSDVQNVYHVEHPENKVRCFRRKVKPRTGALMARKGT